jgi:transcriptional regulator with XRE-family HTH domain
MPSNASLPTNPGGDIASVNAALSRKIRALRHAHSLTLDELARRAGVSKGTLVEIEKGEANPSIALLCKAAAAFGVSVADIVDVTETSPVPVALVEEAPVLWHGPKGGTATLLVGTSGPDMIELWKWVMAPGEMFESPGHPQGTLELLYVERGVLTVRVDESSFDLKTGSSALARTANPHSYANGGRTELRFFMTAVEMHRRGR